MIDEQTWELIQGDLDGVLSPAQKRELESALAASDEARREHELLSETDACLSALPLLEPQASIESRVMGAVDPPASGATNVYPLRSGKPAAAPVARYGMAAAAGVLLTVLLYESAEFTTSPSDMDAMRGTAAPESVTAQNPVAPIIISGPGFEGEAQLAAEDEGLVLSLRLRAAEALTLTVDTVDPAWRIARFSQTQKPAGTVQVSDSRITLASVGQGDIELVLSRNSGRAFGDSDVVTLRFAREGALLSTHTLTPGHSG